MNAPFRILFVCHGNILKSPGKASKINGFTKQKGAYYRRTVDERAVPHPVRVPRQHLTIRANRLINERFALIF